MPLWRVEWRDGHAWRFLAAVHRETRDEAIEYVRGELPRKCAGRTMRAQLAPVKDQPRKAAVAAEQE